MIKAIIFDLDDTLYDYKSLNPKAVDAVAQYVNKKFNVTPSTFKDCYFKARKIINESLHGTAASHNRLLYFQRTLEILRKNPIDGALEMYDIYWNYMLSNMKLCEGGVELFDFCQKNNIKIGICTDLTAHIQHRKLKVLGISQYIDAIVTSEEAGVEKPGSRMFDLIKNKLNVNVNETIFIGDSLNKDIIGAESFGMKTLWMNKDGTNPKYTCIKSLKEIGSHLNEYI